jgi:hypothetical protein
MAPQSTSAMSSQLAYFLNGFGMSCKKDWDASRSSSWVYDWSIELGEIESCQGLNQEMRLSRPGDTDGDLTTNYNACYVFMGAFG